MRKARKACVPWHQHHRDTQTPGDSAFEVQKGLPASKMGLGKLRLPLPAGSCPLVAQRSPGLCPGAAEGDFAQCSAAAQWHRGSVEMPRLGNPPELCPCLDSSAFLCVHSNASLHRCTDLADNTVSLVTK